MIDSRQFKRRNSWFGVQLKPNNTMHSDGQGRGVFSFYQVWCLIAFTKSRLPCPLVMVDVRSVKTLTAFSCHLFQIHHPSKVSVHTEILSSHLPSLCRAQTKQASSGYYLKGKFLGGVV